MDNQNWINLTLWFVSGVASGFLLYGPLKFILEQFHQINQKFEETNATVDEVKSRLEQSDQEMDVLKSQIENRLSQNMRRIEEVFTEVSNRIENIEDRLRRVELKCDFPQFPEPYWPPNYDDETDESTTPRFPNIPK